MYRDPDCIFCRFVAGDRPCFKVHEDAMTLAFMDITPVNTGHCLVIPRAHFADLFVMDDTALAAVATTARHVARAIRDVVAADGINLVQANGTAAGQTVRHFHIHVLPRHTGDGRLPNWERRGPEVGDLQALSEEIRRRL